VHLDNDGNLLIDARDTWTVYKVNRTTGAIMWRLGGKNSSFAVQAAPGQQLDNAGEIFSRQHDPEAWAAARTPFSTTTRPAHPTLGTAAA
jgi:hypothetical protein